MNIRTNPLIRISGLGFLSDFGDSSFGIRLHAASGGEASIRKNLLASGQLI
jgi:hypothetical protein